MLPRSGWKYDLAREGGRGPFYGEWFSGRVSNLSTVHGMHVSAVGDLGKIRCDARPLAEG